MKGKRPEEGIRKFLYLVLIERAQSDHKLRKESPSHLNSIRNHG